MTSADAGWVAVAVLGRTRGNRGELTAVPLSSHPERFDELKEVFLFGDGSRFEVESTWWHDGKLIFKFQGIDSIAEAQRWEGSEVRVPISDRIPLAEGEYYQSDLVGCVVVDQESGCELGRVIAWQESGGPGLLELDSGLLIPFARDICREIDPAAGRILARLPQGLKELNERA